MTTTGPLAAHPYFIRLSKTGDPNAAISYNLGNGGPTLDQRAVIDAGFLELTRLGALPANDAGRPPVAACRRRDDQEHDRPAAPAGTATTATATATGRLTGARGRRAARAPATCGRRSSAERGEQGSLQAATERGCRLLDGMSRLRVGRRPHPRAELGAARPRGIAVRHRPDDRLDRLHERRPGRLGLPADLVRRAVRPARRRHRRRPARSSSRRSRRSRYVTHAQGHDDADGDAPGRPHRRRRARRSPSPARAPRATPSTSPQRTPTRTRRRRPRRRPRPPDGTFSRRRPDHRRHDGAQRRRRQPERRDGARTAHRRLRLRARGPCSSTSPTRTTTTTARATTPTRRRRLPAGAFDLQRFQVYDAGTDVIFRVQTRDLSADVRQPARRAAGRRLRPVPARRRRRRPPRSRSATTRSRRPSPGVG